MARLSIKPGITEKGFLVTVREYTPTSVVEELLANSYDADAKAAVVLIDTEKNELHVLDDGIGFSREAMEGAAVLGAGDKGTDLFSRGKRHYLGSYGVGLKSTPNIASKVKIYSVSDDGEFSVTVDWTRLKEALEPGFGGFPCEEKQRKRGQSTGSHILLKLKYPHTEAQLDEYASVLSNLPEDRGQFRCYYGLYSAPQHAELLRHEFSGFRQRAERLAKRRLLKVATGSAHADLDQCQVSEFADKEDRSVKAKVFFAGIDEGKIRSLKPGLRGIYVRIHGRLLKQSFTDRKFTYSISKWVKFENGLCVELSVDWLRDQITLSREGLRFSNPKLEADFKAVVAGKAVMAKHSLAKLAPIACRPNCRLIMTSLARATTATA